MALVTGAAGALGAAVCATFADQGAAVVGVDLRGSGCVHADVRRTGAGPSASAITGACVSADLGALA